MDTIRLIIFSYCILSLEDISNGSEYSISQWLLTRRSLCWITERFNLKKVVEYKVYKLKKSLYRFKQAFCIWNVYLDNYLGKDSFGRCSYALQLIYMNKNKNREILIVCIYMDDMLIIANSAKIAQDFKESMTREFEMTDANLMIYIPFWNWDEATR